MQIYNTLTRQKEEFKPAEPKKVKMFVCGPTVYDYIHVGNARTYTVFDVVAKYLRHKDYDVEYIQNITDIDDKIITRALDLGRDPLDYAKDYADLFLEDIKKLGIDSVSHYEPATKNIDQVIKQVQTLIKKSNAYKIEGDGLYFDLKTFPEYGKLSGRTVEMAEDGLSRIDDNPNKRNRGDFCLWKFSKPEEPGWDSEFGYGRPGWHIEDTAITEKYFGPQYDLHGAGADLMFPHHEAEIAQQESASGLKPFVRYWMHAGFLVNKTQKMSKSLGNFMILREALKNYSPEVLRFYFLSSHYRSPLDYNEELLKQAEAATNRLAEFISRLKSAQNSLGSSATKLDMVGKIKENFEKEMDDDFNTPRAISHIFDLVRTVNPMIDSGKLDKDDSKKIIGLLNNINKVLGIIPEKIQEIPAEIQKLASERETARQQKDFTRADELREQIKNLGYEVEDTNYGALIKKLPQAS
ncbi:MAG: cysteine--tRNA ligase [Candidatus Yanofskybacteria bacterium]|nr:cysteine--tRNA ligase [Candidatus Yanofskybacteria bacterium]